MYIFPFQVHWQTMKRILKSCEGCAVLTLILAPILGLGTLCGHAQQSHQLSPQAARPVDPALLARAREGDPRSEMLAGVAYLKGSDLKSRMSALIWLTTAANAGDPTAQFILGMDNLIGGIFGTKSPEMADGWLRKAKPHAEKIDYQGARAYPPFQIMTTLGDAFFVIGGNYEHGDGLPEDRFEAADWMLLGARRGNVNAEATLGSMYAEGNGVPQDYPQALSWLRKAAEHGQTDAEYNLAILYLHGHGVAEDDGEAARWLRKAAEQGVAHAQLQLGTLYSIGHGVPQDYSEAYFWSDLAAAGLSGSDQKLASDVRNSLAKILTSQEISDVQRRATAWFAAHPPQH